MLHALLIPEGAQHVIHLVKGLGVLQPQLVQPVRADHGAGSDVAVLPVELGEAADGAIIGHQGLPKLGIGLEPGQQVGHVVFDVGGQIDEEILLDGLIDGAVIVVDGLADHVGEVAAGHHQLELFGFRHKRNHGGVPGHVRDFLQLPEDDEFLHVLDHVVEVRRGTEPDGVGVRFIKQGILHHRKLRGGLFGRFRGRCFRSRCGSFFHSRLSFRRRGSLFGRSRLLNGSRGRCFFRRSGSGGRGGTAAGRQSKQHGDAQHQGENSRCVFHIGPPSFSGMSVSYHILLFLELLLSDAKYQFLRCVKGIASQCFLLLIRLFPECAI